jgi:hypothetical protein
MRAKFLSGNEGLFFLEIVVSVSAEGACAILCLYLCFDISFYVSFLNNIFQISAAQNSIEFFNNHNRNASRNSRNSQEPYSYQTNNLKVNRIGYHSSFCLKKNIIFTICINFRLPELSKSYNL